MINEQYDESQLKEGYAPFCKHLFIPNICPDARVNVLPITADNEHLIRTKYEARTDLEVRIEVHTYDTLCRRVLLSNNSNRDIVVKLPVLIRYFPKESVVLPSQPLPVAKYLDLILYSREQINKENDAMNKKPLYESSAPWGVVSIKAQDVDYEIPMNPITMMRNALGKEYGGSGVPLDQENYMKSYMYWKDHAIVS